MFWIIICINYYQKRQIKQMYIIVQDCIHSNYYIPVFINRSCNNYCACNNDMYAKLMAQKIFIIKLSPAAKSLSVSNNNGE